MATTYPLSVPTLTLTITGADRSAEVLARTLTVRQILGSQVDTASWSMKSPESWRAAATTKPLVGNAVVILVTGVRVFTGQISRVAEVKMAHKTVRWDIEAVDNTVVLTRTLVNENYQNLTVSQIVLAMLRKYAPSVNVSGVATTTDTVRTVTFAYEYPLQILDRLAAFVGYVWFLDPNNILYFYNPTTNPRTASQSITDTSNNFDELFIQPQLEQVRNRVYVQAGLGLSETVIESFDCDGEPGGVGDTFTLSHAPIVGDIGTVVTESGKVGAFMSLGGVSQRTLMVGYDQAAAANGWLVNTQLGVVARGPSTPVPGDTTQAIFTYQYETPVNIVREDAASIAAVAVLENTEYLTTVSGDRPHYWWPLADTTTQAYNRGQAGVAASGYYAGGYTQQYSGPIAYSPSYAVSFDGSTGQVTMTDKTANRVRVPRAAAGTFGYAIECWFRGFESLQNRALVCQAYNDGVGGIEGPTLGFDVRRGYMLTHENDATEIYSYTQPTPGRFDHVVAQYCAGSGMIYVNNTLAGGPTVLAMFNLDNLADFPALQLMRDRVNANNMPGQLAHVAVYSGALSESQIANHYYAAKWAGVREQVVNVNRNMSFDAARNIATGTLKKYANVLTDITFSSLVPPWQIGDSVTVNVTSANLGRTYSGTGLIQELTLRWLGAQRVQYEIHCVDTRYNYMDKERDLINPPELTTYPTQGLNLIRGFTGRAKSITPVLGDSLTLTSGGESLITALGAAPTPPLYVGSGLYLAVASGQAMPGYYWTVLGGEHGRVQVVNHDVIEDGSGKAYDPTRYVGIFGARDANDRSFYTYGLFAGAATHAIGTGTLVAVAAEPYPFGKNPGITVNVGFDLLTSGLV